MAAVDCFTMREEPCCNCDRTANWAERPSFPRKALTLAGLHPKALGVFFGGWPEMPAALDKKYLEQRPAHKGRWYVVRDVPADVRGVLGKRLVKALGTHDLRKARAMRHAVLADFERQIADARKPGADAVTREALEHRDDLQRLDAGDGSVISIAYEGGGGARHPREEGVGAPADRRSGIGASRHSQLGRAGRGGTGAAGRGEKFHGIASGQRPRSCCTSIRSWRRATAARCHRLPR